MFSEETPLNVGKTLFAQLMDFLPWSTFTRILTRYDGDRRVRTLAVLRRAISGHGLRATDLPGKRCACPPTSNGLNKKPLLKVEAPRRRRVRADGALAPVRSQDGMPAPLRVGSFPPYLMRPKARI